MVGRARGRAPHYARQAGKGTVREGAGSAEPRHGPEWRRSRSKFFRRARFSGSFALPGASSLGTGWLTRHGIDGAVHEFNCHWLEGAQDFPSRRYWEDYGANLVTVLDEYFVTVKP